MTCDSKSSFLHHARHAVYTDSEGRKSLLILSPEAEAEGSFIYHKPAIWGGKLQQLCLSEGFIGL